MQRVTQLDVVTFATVYGYVPAPTLENVMVPVAETNVPTPVRVTDHRVPEGRLLSVKTTL
jgi:hypothetical protein